MAKPKEGDLRVWWVPQVPMKAFRVPVRTLREAKLLLETLGDYDIFQFDNNVKPDFSNAGGLEVFHAGDWESYYSPDDEELDVLTDKQIDALDKERSESDLHRPA